MATKTIHSLIRLSIFALLGLTLGCQRTLDDLEPASAPVDGTVFLDAFSGGLEYAAFGGSDVTAFEVVEEGAYEGTAVMRFSVPDQDDPRGLYAGGAFTVPGGRDLSSFNVLTFWARASKEASIDVLGFGNDLGAGRFVTTVTNTPVNTNWRKYYIPIPDASKLTKEGGMFFYSEAPEEGRGYTFWIDEVQFENLGTIARVEAGAFSGQDSSVTLETGSTFSSSGFAVFNLPSGVNQQVDAAAAYFDYTTSDPMVATVSPDGIVMAMDAGEATITATLAGEEATGTLTVTSTGPLVKPEVAAPTPTVPAEDVISIFSNAYENEPIDYLNGFWVGDGSTTQSEVIPIAGDDVVRYSQLNFVGIQFTAPPIDISAMTHFHMDIWTPDQTELPAEFRILLIDLGPDGTFEGSDGSSHTVTLTRETTPSLQTESWISIDLPLSEFAGLVTRSNLAQVGLSGDLPNVFVDNVYFYDDGQGGGVNPNFPPAAAPAPTESPADVISIYSNAYSNEPIDFLNGFWEGSTTQSAEVQVGGDDMVWYTDLNFVGVQFTNPTVDISAMTHVHIDLWTRESTAPPVGFNVKLTDFGPNGVFDGGGDDSEHELTITSPTLQTESWISLDIPLSDFVGLTGRNNLAQVVFSGDISSIFVDNIYFYDDGGQGGGGGPSGGAPEMAAPTPMLPAANVISLYSDAYTDVPVDVFRTDWSVGTMADTTIGGNATKIYDVLDFAGIETVMNQVDATGMTHFHIDVWSPNATFFAIKLVDFGANGVFDGPGSGDDVEHQLEFTGPAQGEWISYDLPLSDFVNLTTRANVAQYVLVGQPSGTSKFYVDNLYFHN